METKTCSICNIEKKSDEYKYKRASCDECHRKKVRKGYTKKEVDGRKVRKRIFKINIDELKKLDIDNNVIQKIINILK
jgi:hypothetical protein